MNEKQAFSLLVRAIGILVFLDGIKSLWFALAQWEFQLYWTHILPYVALAPSLVYGPIATALGAIMIR